VKACTGPHKTTCGPQLHQRPTPIIAGDGLDDVRQDLFEGQSPSIVEHARPARLGLLPAVGACMLGHRHGPKEPHDLGDAPACWLVESQEGFAGVEG
jgi:hypothetical protein